MRRPPLSVRRANRAAAFSCIGLALCTVMVAAVIVSMHAPSLAPTCLTVFLACAALTVPTGAGFVWALGSR